DEYEITRVVAEYDNEAVALAAQAALRAAGIEAHLTNDNATYATLFGRLQFSPIRLAVAESRTNEARGILARFDVPPGEGWEATAEGAIDGWICTTCDTVTTHDESTCAGCGAERPEGPDDGVVDDEDE